MAASNSMGSSITTLTVSMVVVVPLTVKLPSVQAAQQYADHSLDFVYVDADHSYASVVEDITAWKNKVKQGGFIAGHDSYMPEITLVDIGANDGTLLHQAQRHGIRRLVAIEPDKFTVLFMLGQKTNFL